MTLSWTSHLHMTIRRSKKEEFPLTVKRGFATVIIYKTVNRGKPLYTLAYPSPEGKRVRVNFSDLAEAKREAEARVSLLAQGEVEALKLTGADRQIFVSAVEALKTTGVSLDVAAREFAAAVEILGGNAIVTAARYYRDHVNRTLPTVRVSDAAQQFEEAKRAEGKSRLYLKDIRGMLGRFSKTFQCDLAGISGEALRHYMNAMKTGPVAKNNHRRVIVAFFNWCKGQGWLSQNEPTAADSLGINKVNERDVEIYTPEEVSKLLEHADSEFLPWLALIAFGGMRREEMSKDKAGGLQWEHIDFERNVIIVPAAIAKTGKKRKIPMAPNLRQWLEPFRGNTGPIFSIDPRKRMEKLQQTSGVTWKKNALRHSFGSYRLEVTHNAGQVALEMGNSPKVVLQHYHEIVHADAAQRYWSIVPATAKMLPEFIPVAA